VLKKIEKLSRRWLAGNQTDTRKKPHVIDVALEQNIQHNY
jgi:hypothetical protein